MKKSEIGHCKCGAEIKACTGLEAQNELCSECLEPVVKQILQLIPKVS